MDEVATRFQHPGLQVLRLVSTRMATQGKVQKCMGAPHTHTRPHTSGHLNPCSRGLGWSSALGSHAPPGTLLSFGGVFNEKRHGAFQRLRKGQGRDCSFVA